MGKSIMDCLNLDIFKSGAKLNIYVLAGLGLIYSFWTQGVILRIFDIRITGRYADEMFVLTIVQTYIITYLTTAVALVWGLHIHELRFFKLWGLVKFIEFIFNIASFVGVIADSRYIGYIPVIVLVLAFGVYVAMSVWNLYKNLSETNDTISEEKNIDFTLPKYEAEVPAVHKTIIIN